MKIAMWAVAAAVSAGAVLGTGQAHADISRGYPDTSGYIDALIRDGINPSPTGPVIQLGYGVCTRLRSGVSEHQLIDYEDQTTRVPRGTIIDIVTEAHIYLCPDAPYDGSISA